jgi:ribonuclease HI
MVLFEQFDFLSIQLLVLGIEKLNIITDSQFTINAMTKWIYSWKKNNWKLSRGNQDVKNKKDFQELDQLRQGMDLKWVCSSAV